MAVRRKPEVNTAGVRGAGNRTGSKHTLTAVLTLALIVFISASGCGFGFIVPADTAEETSRAWVNTAVPADPTGSSADVFPVSPVPGSPEDPLAQSSYPVNTELEELTRGIVSKYGGSLENIYDFINNSVYDGGYGLSYEYGDKLTELPGYDELALYILKNGHGVCYHYASLTYYLLRAAGFEACIIYGYRAADDALHYWTMVKTANGWYHFDPLHHQMLLTDSEKSSDEATQGNGLVWKRGIWPATPEDD